MPITSTIALAALHDHPDRVTRAVLQGGFAYRPLSRWELTLCRFARYWRGTIATLPLRERLHHPADVRVFRAAPDYFQFHRDNFDAMPKAAVARRSGPAPCITEVARWVGGGPFTVLKIT